jgi:hypothetical protein
MRPLHYAGVAAALAGAVLAGCAIRHDAAGVTRIGIGLWGLGDPPGVNWNLDWPRREVPDLPAAPRRELPPWREPAHEPGATGPIAPSREPTDRYAVAIDDNRGCVTRCALLPTDTAMAARVDDRGDGRHRH